MHYVLVVCNDEEDTGCLERAFQMQAVNVSVTRMNRGLKVLEFVGNHALSEWPFLIVIDQYLPDIDSLELLTRLKSNQRSKLIPTAIMSGFASEELIREYYLAGANCYYKKPFDLSEWSHMADCLLTLFYNKY